MARFRTSRSYALEAALCQLQISQLIFVQARQPMSQTPIFVQRQEIIKVAVVEDDKRLREALVFQLSTAGFQVATHTSAEEFLEVFHTSVFDCIVTDDFLPGMNGLTASTDTQARDSYVSIVFITGHGDFDAGCTRCGRVQWIFSKSRSTMKRY